MNLEFSKQARADAVSSIQRYFRENMSEPIGNLAAGLLLDFFVEELGAVVYNQAIADAQTRLQSRIADLSEELYVEEFQYWPKLERNRRKR